VSPQLAVLWRKRKGRLAAVAEPTFRRYVIDEILRAANELGIAIKEVSPEDVNRLRSDLADRYGDREHLITFEG
jgi:hypothetical protein